MSSTCLEYIYSGTTHLGFIVIAQKWQLQVEKNCKAHNDHPSVEPSEIFIQDV